MDQTAPLSPAALPRVRVIAGIAGLILLALLAFLPGFASLPVTDRDEARFVQASRQMLESGDPLHIHFRDENRLKKPVGIYWLQSLAALVTGTGAP